MSNLRADVRVWLPLSLALVGWASAFVGIRMALTAYSPGHLALFRFLIASVILGGYALLVRMRLPNKKDIPGIVLAGFWGITVYHVALNFGERTVTAGAASLLVATAPIFTTILAVIVLKDRPSPWAWLGIGVSFAGAGLIAMGEANGLRYDPGVFLVLLSAIATAVYIIVMKPYLSKYGALELTTYAIWIGTVPMLVFLPGLFNAVKVAPLEATLAVVYLGIFPAALAYVAWSFFLSQASATNAASFLYLVPGIAIILAWLVLGEIPTTLSLVGGGVVLTGVIVVNTWG